MNSDFDCHICCYTFNQERRCPRELHCRHILCETCVVTICKVNVHRIPILGGMSCPVCRVITPISGDLMEIRSKLRPNHAILERMRAQGMLEEEEEEENQVVVEMEEDSDVEVAVLTPSLRIMEPMLECLRELIRIFTAGTSFVFDSIFYDG